MSASAKTCMVGTGYIGTGDNTDGLAVAETYSTNLLVIPETADGDKVVKIGGSAFNSCSKIKGVQIPESVTSIGKYSFQLCEGLTSFVVPNSVTVIEEYALSYCTNLEEITIGSSVKSIEENAFWRDTKLKSITVLANDPPSLSDDAFYNSNAYQNATLYVPKGCRTKYSNATNWKYFKNIKEIETGILINEENFPDKIFRNYLLSLNEGKDEKLTDNELSGITNMDVHAKSIHSLKGIEYFTSLKTLDCGSTRITVLDISKNTALTSLDCSGTDLSSLDVSKNTALTSLACSYCQLTSLDVSKNTSLSLLYCYRNQLTSLNVSKNSSLGALACYGNKIKEEAMDNLIQNLPTNKTEKTHWLHVYWEPDENVFTKAHATTVKAKGWLPRRYDGNNWVVCESNDPISVQGDVNGDGDVNGTDLVSLTNIIMGRNAETPASDVNNDGKVNGTDYVTLANIVLGRNKARTRAGSSASLSIESFGIKAGETKQMVIDLSNPQDEITLV